VAVGFDTVSWEYGLGKYQTSVMTKFSQNEIITHSFVQLLN